MIIKFPDDINEVFDIYEAARQVFFDHVGYKEDYVVIPLDDQRTRYWKVDEKGREYCCWADSEAELDSGEGNCYSGTIYTQRFLPKWVYRGAKLTMVCVDTHCDGNKFLMIFDNELERPKSLAGVDWTAM